MGSQVGGKAEAPGAHHVSGEAGTGCVVLCQHWAKAAPCLTSTTHVNALVWKSKVSLN